MCAFPGVMLVVGYDFWLWVVLGMEAKYSLTTQAMIMTLGLFCLGTGGFSFLCHLNWGRASWF